MTVGPALQIESSIVGQPPYRRRREHMSGGSDWPGKGDRQLARAVAVGHPADERLDFSKEPLADVPGAVVWKRPSARSRACGDPLQGALGDVEERGPSAGASDVEHHAVFG